MLKKNIDPITNNNCKVPAWSINYLWLFLMPLKGSSPSSCGGKQEIQRSEHNNIILKIYPPPSHRKYHKIVANKF